MEATLSCLVTIHHLIDYSIMDVLKKHYNYIEHITMPMQLPIINLEQVYTRIESSPHHHEFEYPINSMVLMKMKMHTQQ